MQNANRIFFFFSQNLLSDIKVSLLQVKTICICISLNYIGIVIIWYRIKYCTVWHQYCKITAHKEWEKFNLQGIWTTNRIFNGGGEVINMPWSSLNDFQYSNTSAHVGQHSGIQPRDERSVSSTVIPAARLKALESQRAPVWLLLVVVAN